MADEKSSFPLGMEKEPISLEEESAAVSRVMKHANDADEAMKAFQDGEIDVIDEATSKRLLRTIDLNIMPVSCIHGLDRPRGLTLAWQLLCVVYGLNYLDSMGFFRELAIPMG